MPSASLVAYKAAEYWQLFGQACGNTPGDVDDDGIIGVTDITQLIDSLMGAGQSTPRANVDGDGSVSIIDVTILIDMILGVN